jgi:hypothetical protein
MSRYTPRHTYDDFWEVEGLEDSHYLAEAEAGIIAFALNTVAEGRYLAKVTSYSAENDPGVEVYDGPTEGVARKSPPTTKPEQC